MGMTPELIRKEFRKKQSPSIVKSNHRGNAMVCIRLFGISNDVRCPDPTIKRFKVVLSRTFK